MADNDLPWFSTMGGDETTDAPDSQADRPAGNLEFPGYEIIKVLGRGGMGEVFLARDAQLGRLVAIKTMIGSADPRRLERFADEAKAIAKLSHPNIAKVHAFGSVRGMPYLVMEYVGGGTLADLPADRLSDPRSAAQLAIVIARAVQHAHEQGIIHRDLKPSNLLLAHAHASSESDTSRSPFDRKQERTTDWSDSIRVADFGLAKQLGDSQQRTATGEILGTPSYMAPEQASGVFHEIGPATDVRAIGAILYECVTGRPPHLGSDSVQTLLLLLTTDPVSPRVLQPKLSRDLETIILKCLARNPRSRYASAQALIDDLMNWLEGKPITARRTSAIVRATRWIRRHPATSSIVTLVVVSIASFMILQQVATTRLKRANDRASLLLGIVNNSIPQLDSLDAAQRRAVEQVQWMTAAESLESLAAQVPAGDPLRFQAEQIRIKYLMGLALNAELRADIEEQKRLLRETDQSLDQIVPADEDGLAVLDFQLWGWRMISVHYDRMGDYGSSITALEKALAAYGEFVDRFPNLESAVIERQIELLNSLGVSNMNAAETAIHQGDDAGVTKHFEQAEKAFGERLELVLSDKCKSLAERDLLIADAATASGTFFGTTGRYEDSIAQLRLATPYYETLLRENPSLNAQTDLLRNLSNLCLFETASGTATTDLANETKRISELLVEIEPNLESNPSGIEIAVTAYYIVASASIDQGNNEEAVSAVDRGLRWVGYRLSRTDDIGSLLVMSNELISLRSTALDALGQPNRLPVFPTEFENSITASEQGFVLALLRKPEALAKWLSDYRDQWNDPLSQQLAQRIEELSASLQPNTL